jgi:hypothetical protein
MSKKNKTLDTLVDDIYDTIGVLSDGKQIKIPNKLLEELGVDIASAVSEWATPVQRNKATTQTLRMSNIGKPERQLWFDMHEDKDADSELHPTTLIKFLYGHILEVLLIFFVKLAGHKVTAEQKQVSVKGIKGHMDCKIDGEVVDIKTASGYAFKKFKEGTLAEQDNFGYLAQLAGYEHAEKTSEGGFLAFNKETGELALFKPQDLDKPNITSKIDRVKKIIKSDSPPDYCFDEVPEGKSGNMKLPRECTFCPYKFKCRTNSNDGAGLRVFNYAKGPVYFTKVVKEPNVEEVL